VEAAAKSAGTTVSELRGTTVPFTSLQSAVSRNMLESLKVGVWQWRSWCEYERCSDVWVGGVRRRCTLTEKQHFVFMMPLSRVIIKTQGT
jgi:hypothetical protein